jgi:hypothetical protein
MSKSSVIQKLRNKESITLYRDGLFTRIQLNRRDNRICWERWVSKDQRSWMNWNLFLSLRDVLQIYSNYENNK